MATQGTVIVGHLGPWGGLRFFAFPTGGFQARLHSLIHLDFHLTLSER